MRRRQRALNAGFTLIEVMVAMTILVVLVGGVYVCFASVADTADIARTASEELRLKQFVWNHLRDHLSSISPKIGGEYALVGEDDSGPYGDADTLRFTTSLPMAGAKSLPGMAKTVEYYIDDPSYEDTSGFRTFDEEPEQAIEGVSLFITESPLRLLAGEEGELFQEEGPDGEEEGQWEREITIRSINFEYYDGEAEEWAEDWNSAELGILPWAVRVQVNLAKSEEQLYAEARAGVDPRVDFDLEMIVVLPAGAGTLGEFIDPNHFRSVEQEAEEIGEE